MRVLQESCSIDDPLGRTDGHVNPAGTQRGLGGGGIVKYLGLDGCRAGWFMVALEEDGSGAFGVLHGIEELSEYLPRAESALIDVPIGLRGRHADERLCDRMARAVLPRARKSSVFPAPSRCALDCDTYKRASEMNRQCTGRGLSRQSFGILPKIREVDRYLRETPHRDKIREMHPEVCFWSLNDRTAMVFNKKTQEGFEERLVVLERCLPNARRIVGSALARHRTGQVARDDIVDALVGAVTAAHRGPLLRMPESPETDDEGLPMEIVFAGGHPSSGADVREPVPVSGGQED
jgi:predicted RNase H-like nuclease